MNYDQLLFSELRLVPAAVNDAAELDEQALVTAMTANEEILKLGYTLSPKDIIRLSKSQDMNSFYQRVKDSIGDVKAEPMYPDFPSQVMELNEAVLRFHQLVHYLSTYGIEDFTGTKVTRGWLPEMKRTEKTDYDRRLLDSKVIALIPEQEKYVLPYKRIVSNTERMTDKEKMIVAECVKHLSPEELSSARVTFKQNLIIIFDTVFGSEELDSAAKLSLLRSLCQHTGDVWKCMDYSLTRAGFHFRTSQKRLIVKLLECYPLSDFKSNLILSNKKGERTELMLRYTDFNEYSRSPAHKAAVASFRCGELRSWESRAKYLVGTKDPGAIDYYAERPGMLLRAITYLLRNGYSSNDILKALVPHAPDLKTQTLVSLVSFFSRPGSAWKEGRAEEAHQALDIVKPLLLGRLCANETALKNKRVYVDMPGFDLDQSAIRVTDKSSEGGYIRSGLAYKIPDGVNRIRFFIYWNDKNRVDIDLHASAVSTEGELVNIGWNANYKSGALVFSGDITHSDAAEYIDIDLVSSREHLDTVSTNINLYSGYDTFGEIEECFVGAMAVNKTGEEISLYDPKNCFFTHYLTGKYRTINYGYVDIRNRVIVFDGTKTGGYYSTKVRNNSFPVSEYLDILLLSQNAEQVEDKSLADLVLVMGKPSADNEISLTDNNFFMEG